MAQHKTLYNFSAKTIEGDNYDFSALKGKKESSPQAASPPQQTVQKPTTVYYDFGDVLVPRELKLEKEASFILNTPGLTAGMLTLKGSVDSRSLTNFFKNRMAADGWEMVSAITAPRARMLFKKNTRWCVISIDEGRLSTLVEIWVSPTLDNADLGLTK